MDTTITAVLREAEKQTEELLALEDTGWMNLSTSASGQTDPERQLSVRRARLFFARDPLARQAIRLWTDYTFGPGLTWNLEKGASRDAFEAFWSGPGNTTVLNSAGQRKSSDKLLVDGEIFFALFFTDPPKLRRVDPLEITEIISDEDDADDVRYFKREWTTPFSTSKTGIYKSLGNTDDKAAKDVYGNLVTATEQDVVMLHLPINTIGLRGNSTLLPALDWIKLYRQFLASRVAIMLALARFAWKGKLSGNQATVDTAVAKIQDASPKAGSTWIENQGMDLQPIHTDTGAANAYQDARMLKLQICAATGIPEQYFGDVSVGSLATASTVELPLQKMFASYQTVWADLYRQIANAVMLNANVEPMPVDFDFPAITPEDSGAVAASIAQLMVAFPALANSPDVMQQALMSIGVNNVQAVIDSLSKESRDPAVVAAEALRKFRVMLEANGHV